MRITFGCGLSAMLLLAAPAIALAQPAPSNDTVKAHLANCGPTPSKACSEAWYAPVIAVEGVEGSRPGKPRFCPPNTSVFEQVDAAIAWLRGHPETWSKTTTDGVLMAFEALYPCR